MAVDAIGGSMAKRFKLSRRGSKKMFSRSASRTHRKNVMHSSVTSPYIMRGGTRL